MAARGDGYYEVYADVEQSIKNLNKLDKKNKSVFENLNKYAKDNNAKFVKIQQDGANQGTKAHQNAAKKTQFAYKNAMSAINTFVGGAIASLGGMLARGLVRSVRESIKAFVDLDKGIREVTTLLSDEDIAKGGGFEGLKKQAQELAYTFGQDVTTSTKAMYQAISGGTPVEQLGEQMEAAGKLSVGGLVDLNTAVDALNVAQNAYGINAKENARITDAFFIGMKNGITTVDQLSQNIGKVAPIASQMNVSLEETVAAMSAITTQGVSTSQATTMLQNTIKSILKPSKSAQDILSELGIEFGDAALKNQTLQEWLEKTKTALEGSGRSFKDVFGNVRALNGAMILTGAGAEKFTGIMEEMSEASKNSGETTEKAFKTMEESVDMKLKRVKQSLQNAFINMFERLYPAIEKILPILQDSLIPLIEKIGSLIQALMPAIQVIFDVIGGIATFVTSIIAPVESATRSFQKMYDTAIQAGEQLKVIANLNAGSLNDMAGIIEKVNAVSPELANRLQRIADSSLDAETKTRLFNNALRDTREELTRLTEGEKQKYLHEFAMSTADTAKEFDKLSYELDNLNKKGVLTDEDEERVINIKDRLEELKLSMKEKGGKLLDLGFTKQEVDTMFSSVEKGIIKTTGMFESMGIGANKNWKKLYDSIFELNIETFELTEEQLNTTMGRFAQKYIDVLKGNMVDEDITVPVTPEIEGDIEIDESLKVDVEPDFSDAQRRIMAFDNVISRTFKGLSKEIEGVTLGSWEDIFNKIEAENKTLQAVIKNDTVMNEEEKAAAIEEINRQTAEMKQQLFGEELTAIDTIKQAQQALNDIVQNETLSHKQKNDAIKETLGLYEAVRANQEGMAAAGSVEGVSRQIKQMEADIAQFDKEISEMGSDMYTEAAKQKLQADKKALVDRKKQLEEEEKQLKKQVEESNKTITSTLEGGYDGGSSSTSRAFGGAAGGPTPLEAAQNRLAIWYAEVENILTEMNKKGATDEEILAKRIELYENYKVTAQTALELHKAAEGLAVGQLEIENQKAETLAFELELLYLYKQQTQLSLENQQKELDLLKNQMGVELKRLELEGAGQKELYQFESDSIDKLIEKQTVYRDETMALLEEEKYIKNKLKTITDETTRAELERRLSEIQGLVTVQDVYNINSELLDLEKKRKEIQKEILKLQQELTDYIEGTGNKIIKDTIDNLDKEVEKYTELNRLVEEGTEQQNNLRDAFIDRNVEMLTGTVDLKNITDEMYTDFFKAGKAMKDYFTSLEGNWTDVISKIDQTMLEFGNTIRVEFRNSVRDVIAETDSLIRKFESGEMDVELQIEAETQIYQDAIDKIADIKENYKDSKLLTEELEQNLNNQLLTLIDIKEQEAERIRLEFLSNELLEEREKLLEVQQNELSMLQEYYDSLLLRAEQQGRTDLELNSLKIMSLNDQIRLKKEQLEAELKQLRTQLEIETDITKQQELTERIKNITKGLDDELNELEIERKNLLEEQNKIIYEQYSFIVDGIKKLVSAFSDGEISFKEFIGAMDGMINNLLQKIGNKLLSGIGGEIAGAVFEIGKALYKGLMSIYQDTSISQTLTQQYDASVKFNDTLEQRNKFLEIAKDLNSSLLDSTLEQLQYTQETNALIEDRYNLENKSAEELANEMQDRQDTIKQLEYAIQDLDNVDWGAWFGLDQADDEFFKNYESLLNSLGYSWENFKAGKYSKEEIMNALRTAKDLTEEEIKALEQYADGLKSTQELEEELWNLQKDVLVKRMKLQGKTETEIQQAQLEFLEKEIEMKQQEMKEKGYSLDLENELLDLELERLDVIKAMNGELGVANYRYDEFIKAQIRSVIQARALGDTLKENEALTQAASALAAYGLSTDEINQLLGTSMQTQTYAPKQSSTIEGNESVFDTEGVTSETTGGGTGTQINNNAILGEQLAIMKNSYDALLVQVDYLKLIAENMANLGTGNTGVETSKQTITEKIRKDRRDKKLIER